MLDPETYQVHEVGAASADVTEGSAVMGGIWARESYDWSLQGTVRAVVRESNVFAPGRSWELTVEALPDGGSGVSWLARRRGAGFKGRLLTTMLRFRGEKVLAGYLEETLSVSRSRQRSNERRAAGESGGLLPIQPHQVRTMHPVVVVVVRAPGGTVSRRLDGSRR